QEAYVEYLRSISFIAQALLEEATAAEVTPPGQRWRGRLGTPCAPRRGSRGGTAPARPVKPAAPEKGPSPAPVSRHRRVFSDEGGKLSPFLPPEIFQKLQLTKAQGTKKELTPLEEASLQNQKLRATYEARVAREDLPGKVQKEGLALQTLSLQRQMMENLVVAKAREETPGWREGGGERELLPQSILGNGMQMSVASRSRGPEPSAFRGPPGGTCVGVPLPSARQLPAGPELHQALAARGRAGPFRGRPSPCSVPAPPAQAEAPRAPTRPLCFADAVAPAADDGEPGGCQSPGGDRILPSWQWGAPRAWGGFRATALPRLQEQFGSWRRVVAWSESRGRGVGDGASSTYAQRRRSRELPVLSPDRLLSLTLLAFEGLNSTSSKDQCLACIEDAFFSPLWAPLLALYRGARLACAGALPRRARRHRPPLAPACFSAPTGRANPNLFPQNSAAPAAGSYPYSRAVQELGLMLLESCPQKKLDCIVRTLRVICECAEEYKPAGLAAPLGGRAPSGGADDLLPILSYVVLKSNLPQLAAECAALEEFIHEGYLIGEEGYCLTSLQSALSYVESLPGGALGQ
uniref:VPS9 domain containing 1 n=1 Tax=Pelodiscus sinensis TaxID=13735 RepID=K7FR30_PELSI